LFRVLSLDLAAEFTTVTTNIGGRTGSWNGADTTVAVNNGGTVQLSTTLPTVLWMTVYVGCYFRLLNPLYVESIEVSSAPLI
jgi:hypothetical protein